MKRYEYKTVSIKVTGFFNKKFDTSKVNQGLNTLGAQGWELVNTSRLTVMGDTQTVVAFLKREVEE